MNIEALPKKLYDKAKELEIETITLQWEGGSDEGFLNVEIEPYKKENKSLADEIEEWAWNVYEYSGAGDGSPYGDTITYDLKNNRATTQEWYHVETHGKKEEEPLSVTDEE